jgi:hypothetical protein
MTDNVKPADDKEEPKRDWDAARAYLRRKAQGAAFWDWLRSDKTEANQFLLETAVEAGGVRENAEASISSRLPRNYGFPTQILEMAQIIIQKAGGDGERQTSLIQAGVNWLEFTKDVPSRLVNTTEAFKHYVEQMGKNGLPGTHGRIVEARQYKFQ